MLVLKKNNIPNLVKRFKELHKKKFEVGYWDSQGKHNSGLSYPNIFAILSYGSTKINLPARPVLNLEFSTFSPIRNNLEFKNNLKLYFSNIKSKSPISVDKVLSMTAKSYVDVTRNSFGDISKLHENSDFTQYLKAKAGVRPNNPLIWTGGLVSHLAYSINGAAIIIP